MSSRVQKLVKSALFTIINNERIRKYAMETLNLTPLRPLMVWVVKKTVFPIFCGGETMSEAKLFGRDICGDKIRGIWSFAAEIYEEKTATTEQRLRDYVIKGNHESIDIASELNNLQSGQSSPHMIAIKLSNYFSQSELDLMATWKETQSIKSAEYRRAILRRLTILRCFFERAHHENVIVTVDAEHCSIQDALDRLAITFIRIFNRSSPSPFILNTYQMYRKDGLQRMKKQMEATMVLGSSFGAKIVRGAYMNYEIADGQRHRLVPTREACDTQYNQAVKYLFQLHSKLGWLQGSNLKAILATHNLQSIVSAIQEAKLFGCEKSIRFAQLYGMRDDLALMIKANQMETFKHIPWGDAKYSIPYLARRIQENPSIIAQEIAAIKANQLRKT